MRILTLSKTLYFWLHWLTLWCPFHSGVGRKQSLGEKAQPANRHFLYNEHNLELVGRSVCARCHGEHFITPGIRFYTDLAELSLRLELIYVECNLALQNGNRSFLRLKSTRISFAVFIGRMRIWFEQEWKVFQDAFVYKVILCSLVTLTAKNVLCSKSTRQFQAFL